MIFRICVISIASLLSGCGDESKVFQADGQSYFVDKDNVIYKVSDRSFKEVRRVSVSDQEKRRSKVDLKAQSPDQKAFNIQPFIKIIGDKVFYRLVITPLKGKEPDAWNSDLSSPNFTDTITVSFVDNDGFVLHNLTSQLIGFTKIVNQGKVTAYTSTGNFILDPDISDEISGWELSWNF